MAGADGLSRERHRGFWHCKVTLWERSKRGARQSVLFRWEAGLTQESDNDDAADDARHDQACVAGLLGPLTAPVGRPTIVIPVATARTLALRSSGRTGITLPF